jgi:hypothetical protein
VQPIRLALFSTNKHAAYPPAIAGLRTTADDLDERLPARPEPYLNNILEQDHPAINDG